MAEPGHGFAPGRHAIEGLGGGGFLFGGTSHVGSILMLPDGVHVWPVVEPAQMDVVAIGPILAAAADIDFLLIGTGPRFVVAPAATLAAFKQAGIRFEMMSTSSAAQTYNILLAEGRKVAAALIAVA